MITTINEFKFSKHYQSDKNNRIALRIAQIKLTNKVKPEFEEIFKKMALNRTKHVLYHLLLSKLNDLITPINGLFCTGNLMLMANDKQLIGLTDIQTADGYTGNKYVAIVKDSVVLTILLYPSTLSDNDIISKANKHLDELPENGKKILYDKVTYFDDKKARKINLSLSDDAFMKLYPLTKLHSYNLPAAKNIIDDGVNEIEFSDDNVEDIKFSNAFNIDKGNKIIDKEVVIQPGSIILFKKGDKYIKREVIETIVDSVNAKTYYLRFKDKPKEKYLLEKGKNIILTPNSNNTNTKELFNKFNIEITDDEKVHFRGRIIKIQHYTPEKNGSINGPFIYDSFGVVILPTSFIIED